MMPQNKLPSFAEIMTSNSDSLKNNNSLLTSSCESVATSRVPGCDTAGTSYDGNSDCYYTCKLCDKTFETKDDMTSHKCLDDPNVNVLFECQECKSLFQSLEGLAQHMKEHKQHVVLLDDKLPNSLTRLGFTCSYCNKVLSTKGSLMKHQELHKGLKPFSCNFCDKQFSLKGNRDKHELIHAGDKPHTCNICNKMFTLKGNLQQHLLTHSNLKSFKCSECGKEFTLKGNLDKHLKRHEEGMKKPRNSSSKKRKVVDFDAEAEEEELIDTWEIVSERVALRDGKLVKITKKRLLKRERAEGADDGEGTSDVNDKVNIENEQDESENYFSVKKIETGVSSEEGEACISDKSCKDITTSNMGVESKQEGMASNNVGRKRSRFTYDKETEMLRMGIKVEENGRSTGHEMCEEGSGDEVKIMNQ